MCKQYIMETYKRIDVTFITGEGTWLTDVKGNRYLDFVAGIAVNSLGHCHPEVVETISEQASKLLHVSNLYSTKPQMTLAKKLVELSDHKSIFFCNSGTEAVEGALKVVKKYGHKSGKKKIICFTNSFHGRSLGALSVTGQEKYRSSFGSMLESIEYCEFNNLDSVKKVMTDEVCGIIVEPIQGEGGIIPGETSFLKGLRTLCDKHDALLVFDEIQCGIGRLGSFYAYQNVGVIPDVVCMAKGLGSGIPIGAFLVNEKADVLTYGDHGSTFGGNPLICSTANVVVNIISNRMFLNKVEQKSAYLYNKLKGLMSTSDKIKSIRGKGLMIGIELNIPAKDVVMEAFNQKLLLISAGENIIRVVPPLNVSDYEIDLFIKKLEDSIENHMCEAS